MSGLLNTVHDIHQQHKERRGERHHEHHGRDDDCDNYDGHGRHHGRRHDDNESDDERRLRSYPSQGQYAPPPDAPAFSSLGGLDRGDFASDEDVERMVASGEFNQRQRDQDAYGRYDAPSAPPPGPGYRGRGNDYGRYDAPSGPPSYGHGERASERYDAPSGPPTGRGGVGYGGGPDRQHQYGSQEPQGRAQYDASQGHYASHAQKLGNAPSGGFGASRDAEEQYDSEYGGPPKDRYEPPRRGESASHYDPPGDRYAHLASIAQAHGGEDPEVYRQATQGLHDRIQVQAQSRPSGQDGGYNAHVDAHRRAYEEDDHGPMDTDAIGAAAAMEAFKQTAAAAKSSKSNAPAGAFQAGKASGDFPSKPGRAARDQEEDEEEATDTTAARAGATGGLQDKLMALAMSQAGKLFDKKNAGSSGGDKAQDKAQAMQSAAATAMQLFTQYQSKGKLESGDMSKVIGLAMNLL